MEKSVLYVVATPIGNLSDISLRALEVLASVDVVAAEHVQTSVKLLNHHAIQADMIALHQHNEVEIAEKIVDRLKSGQTAAVITDAGTPGISDPGARLVDRVRAAGYPVVPIPGANAAICALSAAGINNPHFLFYGFLPTKSGLRKKALAALKDYTCTLVFYEAPHRVIDCIHDCAEILGPDRDLTIARELTKLFETIHTCALSDAVTWLQADVNRQKGEFVLLLSGAAIPDKTQLSEQALHTLTLLLADLPLKKAVQLTAGITGENKNALYKQALLMKAEE